MEKEGTFELLKKGFLWIKNHFVFLGILGTILNFLFFVIYFFCIKFKLIYWNIPDYDVWVDICSNWNISMVLMKFLASIILILIYNIIYATIVKNTKFVITKQAVMDKTIRKENNENLKFILLIDIIVLLLFFISYYLFFPYFSILSFCVYCLMSLLVMFIYHKSTIPMIWEMKNDVKKSLSEAKTEKQKYILSVSLIIGIFIVVVFLIFTSSYFSQHFNKEKHIVNNNQLIIHRTADGYLVKDCVVKGNYLYVKKEGFKYIDIHNVEYQAKTFKKIIKY